LEIFTISTNFAIGISQKFKHFIFELIYIESDKNTRGVPCVIFFPNLMETARTQNQKRLDYMVPNLFSFALAKSMQPP
jgi:hypothetical protein